MEPLSQFFIRYLFIFTILFVTNSLVVAAQDTDSKKYDVDIKLRPEKARIMLGEPMFLEFEVTNRTPLQLCLSIGGDYRNRLGRPESFRVTVSDSKGIRVPGPENNVNQGGMHGCAVIGSAQTYTIRLFLSHWATIERTGTYHVNVRRRMEFSAYEPPTAEDADYTTEANVSAEFEVVPYDENAMGAVINSLGSVMLDESNPRANDSGQALAEIRDQRVIGYFVDAVRKFGNKQTGTDGYFLSRKAISALATYDDDRAIEAFASAMNSSNEDTRARVAEVLGKSAHRSAKSLLLKMQDDPDRYVRIQVARGLTDVKTKEALAVLQKLLKDKDEDVREATQIVMNTRKQH